MALATGRYTYDNNAVTANSVVTVATIEVPFTSGTSTAAPPLGIRLKLDIVASVSGTAYALSGDLILAISYYEDTGSIVFDITPEGKVLEEYGIVDAQDLAAWEHIVFPDLADWFNYVKVLISADVPAGGVVNIYIDVNAPNVNCEFLADTTTWQSI
jgi:hypothetical protein